MYTYELAVCDDEQLHIDTIISYMSAFESEERCQINVKSFLSGRALLAQMDQGDYVPDIILLDVDMPDGSGIEIARELHKRVEHQIICFVTAFEEYAFQAYEQHAIGYITKPIVYKKLKEMLHLAIVQVGYQKNIRPERRIVVSVNGGERIVDVDDILYVEKRRNQCVFHMQDSEFICYGTLAAIFEQLESFEFYYVHQGFLVNFAQIHEVKQAVVCLGNNREVPLSRTYYKKIKDLHMNKIRQLRERLANDN